MEQQMKPGMTLEEIYGNFRAGLVKVAEEAIVDMISRYLPHAETDLDSNVYYRAMDYIAGEFGENTIFGSMGKRFRQRIFEENKDMIINQLNQDHLEEIESLKKELQEWKEAFYRK